MTIYVYNYGGSKNGGTQQPFVFPPKNNDFGVFLGVPPFKETPISPWDN